jgi:hypothetical protein
MKNFEKICRMTQSELKNYMKNYLTSYNYEVVNKDGFLYAKGDIPVLLVAHMDTVHSQSVKQITVVGDRISSPQGIGGDDRCGIYIIAEIVKQLHCSVLLCEDEEMGMIGAKKFARTEYIKNLGVNYMIEFDRKGNNDAVFYDCDNKDFIAFVEYHTGYKKAWGSFSDISSLMSTSEICGVNLSCGYYNAHTTDEYVVFAEMKNAIQTGIRLINAECDEPWEYKEAESIWNNKWHQTTMEDMSDKIKKDMSLELEVVYFNAYGEEMVSYVEGESKRECWLEFFLNNPKICANDIVDYTFI